jgi:hypothetical protein
VKPPTVTGPFTPGQKKMLLDWLPNILREVAAIAKRQALRFTRWPVSIAPMDPKEIAQDEKNGGGHGVYLTDTEEIRLNSTMPPLGIILNLIHELWHHVDPRADEWYINSVIVPWVYDKLTGEVLEPVDWEEFRGHKFKWHNLKRRKK